MLSFKPAFSLSSLTLIETFSSSSSLSATRVVSSAYLRLLIFLPAILIPACASSSPAFHMIYSAYKLKNRCDNIQPWCISFFIWNQSVVPCPVLTVVSWPACRFLKRQVKSLQSCPILCIPMDCSPPGSSVHGILQARILEWVAIPFSRGFSQPRNQTWVSCVASKFLYPMSHYSMLCWKEYFQSKDVTAMIVLVKKMSAKRMEPSYPY